MFWSIKAYIIFTFDFWIAKWYVYSQKLFVIELTTQFWCEVCNSGHMPWGSFLAAHRRNPLQLLSTVKPTVMIWGSTKIGSCISRVLWYTYVGWHVPVCEFLSKWKFMTGIQPIMVYFRYSVLSRVTFALVGVLLEEYELMFLWTKWPPFHRWYVPMHFCERKLSYCD